MCFVFDDELPCRQSLRPRSGDRDPALGAKVLTVLSGWLRPPRTPRQVGRYRGLQEAEGGVGPRAPLGAPGAQCSIFPILEKIRESTNNSGMSTFGVKTNCSHRNSARFGMYTVLWGPLFDSFLDFHFLSNPHILGGLPSPAVQAPPLPFGLTVLCMGF